MAELSARVRIASEAKPLPKMWIGFLLGIIFLAVEIIEGVRLMNKEGQTEIVPFSLFAGIPIWLYWLYCVFKIHDAVGRIPGYRHSITPARAVGMHFVPFYNLYWIFKWPMVLADFVNWRTQANTMRGWIAGIFVFVSVLTFRFVDGFLGAMLLFAGGWYILKSLRDAFTAPPVPESAMRTPSQSILNIG